MLSPDPGMLSPDPGMLSPDPGLALLPRDAEFKLREARALHDLGRLSEARAAYLTGPEYNVE
jgi:hypothetical protein